MVKAKTTAAAPPSATTESVRDRILHTARELFYREGVRGVGVDTVVAQSGVAKTSLYRWFPSKDQLIAAVVEEEAKARWAGWDKTAARVADLPARERLQAHLSGVLRFVNSPTYRGCPFINVASELPDPQHPARVIGLEVTHELRRRIRSLVDAIEGVRDPAQLTDQILLLVEGTLSASLCMGATGPQKYLMEAADALVEAQLKPAVSG